MRRIISFKCISLTAIACALLLCACGQKTHPPMDEALEYIKSDSEVTCVEVPVADWDNRPYYVFSPAAGDAATAFIIYGGSQVDPRSYAPHAYGLARQGYTVVLVSMPSDMALLAPERADTVIDALASVDTWVIGGHSMGGIAASAYAKDNLDKIDAVIMWASYPTEDNRLDQTDLAALTLYATYDGIYTPETVEESLEHLPPGTVMVEIEGGNHFQFGWYQNDHKPYDGDAVISREEQTSLVVETTAAFLDSL